MKLRFSMGSVHRREFHIKGQWFRRCCQQIKQMDLPQAKRWGKETTQLTQPCGPQPRHLLPGCVRPSTDLPYPPSSAEVTRCIPVSGRCFAASPQDPVGIVRQEAVSRRLGESSKWIQTHFASFCCCISICCDLCSYSCYSLDIPLIHGSLATPQSWLATHRAKAGGSK